MLGQNRIKKIELIFAPKEDIIVSAMRRQNEKQKSIKRIYNIWIV